MTDIERAEEFGKEAEEYVRKIRHDVINWDGAEPEERFYNEIKFKQAYQQGAELGYNKAFVEADKNLKAIVADFNKAKKIIKEMLSILPKENIEGVYEITEEAEQFIREVE